MPKLSFRQNGIFTTNLCINSTVLPNYVLIGMPSSESSNALVLPLAGHELGHSVWQKDNLEGNYNPKINTLARQYLKDNWMKFRKASGQSAGLQPTDEQFDSNSLLMDCLSRIVSLTLSQIEETFCDAVGINLFGSSYAYAFHYMLAPSLGGLRSLEYPRLSLRAENLATLSGLDFVQLGFADYKTEFQERPPALASVDDFISEAADTISQQLASEMYKKAKEVVSERADFLITGAQTEEEILKMFEHGVPSHAPRSLADILNAGWKYVMRKKGSFDESERNLVGWTSELILKSVEALEFKARSRHA